MLNFMEIRSEILESFHAQTDGATLIGTPQGCESAHKETGGIGETRSTTALYFPSKRFLSHGELYDMRRNGIQ
jgi:hypothetical protein